MIRSTNNAAVKKIQKYIFDRFEFCDYLEQEPQTDYERILLCRDIFRNEYGFNIKRMGEYRAFKEWLCGVPSAFCIEFNYNDVNNTVCDWLQCTEEEGKRFDDIATWELYLHLLTREFFKMAEKAEKHLNK